MPSSDRHINNDEAARGCRIDRSHDLLDHPLNKLAIYCG